MAIPTVSVITPFYNAGKYLHECIKSILSQTFSDFEFILIDDGSQDDSLNIALSYHDKRLRIIKNTVNEGLAKVRNRGLSESKGRYIAFLDADDISHKERLKKQVRLLDNEPAIGICGTWTKTIGTRIPHINRYFTDPKLLDCEMLFNPPVATSSAMFRNRLAKDNDISFDVDFPPAEDYDFWERLSHYCLISNIPAVLTFYRVHSNQSTKLKNGRIKQYQNAWKIRGRRLNKIGIEASEKEKYIHQIIGRGGKEYEPIFLSDLEEWLKKIQRFNALFSIYPEPMLSTVIKKYWYEGCKASTVLGVKSFIAYSKSDLRKTISTTFRDWLKLFIKSVIRRSGNDNLYI